MNAPNVKGDRLADLAYDHIKMDIITHRLAPGRKVSEGRLVEHTGLGRAPVRVAMSRLLMEGLIVQPSAKTQLVAPLTLAATREIFHLRALLEPDAAALAAGRIDIARLAALNEECAQPYTPGNREEEYRFLLANRAFHLAIARSSGYPLQAQMIERLQDASMRFLWLSLRLEDRPQTWSAGHEDIIQALAAGDPAAARKEAEIHLARGRESVLDVLLQAPEVSTLNLSLA